MSEQRKCSLRTSLLLAACLVLLSGRAAHAQQQSQQQQAGQAAPIPAYVPLGAIGTTDNGDAGQDAPQANALLSGVQNLSVGLETKRSYWQPHFDVTGMADSNSLQTPHGLDWRTYTAISGGVDLHNVTSNSDLMLGYTAGGTFSNDNTVNDGVVQGLNFSEKLSFRRSAISLLDQFSYLPESQFGFGGLGATGLPATGQNVPGLQFNPGQVLLTGRVQTVSNSDAVELDEFVSSRTSLTFSGGYSLLHYFGGSFLDYGVVNSRVGYNYQMTSRDTFAVFYTYGDYRFDLPTNSFDDHSFDLSYGHIINGKLAFQVAAGPVAILPETTTASSPGGSAAAPGNTTQILWSLSTNLEYKERRYGFGGCLQPWSQCRFGSAGRQQRGYRDWVSNQANV